MRGFCLSCAGLLFALLSANGCSKEVKAEFPRPPATAAIPPSEESQPAPEPVEVVDDREAPPEPEPEPEVDEPEREPRKPPPPPLAAEPVEETHHEPPSTQLASADGEVDPDVLSKLERAGSLLSSIGGRDLSQGQREQIAAARGFVAQARRALDEGDERRALVLVDKGLLLAADVERTSRP